MPTGQATTFHVREPGWWTAGMPLVGEFDLDGDGKLDGPKQTEAHSITLWRGTEVKGKLLTPDGDPAAGVALHAGVYVLSDYWLERMGRETNVYESWDHGEWPNWTASVVTLEDGTFSLTVPPNDARSWVRIGTGGLGFQAIDTEGIYDKNKDHALLRYTPFEVEVNGSPDNKRVDEVNGVLDLGTLQLQSGIVLKGRVVDAAGNPLAGIHLYTSSRHGPYAGRKTISGKDGAFEFAPMAAGTFTLSPDATLRDEQGNKRSRDVQAVFVPQEVSLGETSQVVELVVEALPHVELEFEWVDRRTAMGQPVSYYGEFAVYGFVPRDGAKPMWWHGATEKISRAGQEWLVLKVPRSATELKLGILADSRVTPSYQDDETASGPGNVSLGDVTKAKHRVIYGDDPLGSK